MAKSSKRLLRIKIYKYSIFAILILAGISIVVSSLEKEAGMIITGTPDFTESIIKNFRYKKMKDGKLLYTIDAPIVRMKGDRYIMIKPSVIYFSQKRKYRMKSARAVYRKNGNMEATGHIKIKTSDGYIISTEYLRYNAKTRTLYAPQKISITGNKITGRGIGALINIKKGILTIQKDVTIRLTGTKSFM